ncbi:unnamed protein product [Prunus armeniaca]
MQYWSQLLQARRSSSNSPYVESDTSRDQFKFTREKLPPRSWFPQLYEPPINANDCNMNEKNV